MMQKNNDASSLNIICPEHNQYVQHVCLVNQCYQKLLCDSCVQKHKAIHKNQQVSLMDTINSFKAFTKIKLEDGEDLTDIQDQIKKGQRSIRTKDGKVSEIDFFMMQNLNGKDQELKYKLFTEKSQVKKQRMVENQVKSISNEMASFTAHYQRQILAFEKNISESIQNQLRRATSTNIMEQKFLKDSSINKILDDLKTNNNRYNTLSKNLQKFHKGFLELKISKKIFSEMCTDTQTRLRTFQKNLQQFFDGEYQKLFSFMIDTNEGNQVVKTSKQLIINEEQNQEIMSVSDLRIKLASDKSNPNLYMQKMILDLEEISEQTKQDSIQKQETVQKKFNIPQIQKEVPQNGQSLQKNTQDQILSNIQSLDYQKKKVKINLNKIEKDKFQAIQMILSNSQEEDIDDVQIKNLMNFYQNPFSIKIGQNFDQQSVSNMLSPSRNIQQIRSAHLSPKEFPVKRQTVHFDSTDMKSPESSVFFSRKQSTNDISLQSTPRKPFNLNQKSDFKGCRIFTILMNPIIRTFGYLEQLSLQQSIRLSRPLTSFGQINQQNDAFQSIIQNKKQQLTSIQTKDLIQQSGNNSNFNSDRESILIPQKPRQQNSIVIGMDNISDNKFIVVFSDGLLSTYQVISQTFKLNLIKEIQLGEQSLCYAKPKEEGVLLQDSDLILFVSGLSTSKQSQLSVIKYEQKKDKFFIIDTIASFHAQYAKVSQIEVTIDKNFHKNNLPNSLQLVTDAFYVFSLSLFNDDIKQKRSLPTILVQRISFHREKHSSHEKVVLINIEITQNILIQRILFDPLNDFLWGHSDYQVFKWRIHFGRKSLEYSDSFTLIHSSDDIITSMNQNETMVMFTSLKGNLWGIDVMFNSVIQKDFQRFKYRTINNYAKIEGKDQIFIVSGSKASINSRIVSLNSDKVVSNNTSQRSKEMFIYSTLSSSGAKLICFNSYFRDVLCSISGQQNHITHSIYLPSEEILVAVEDFNQFRIWKNINSKLTS